MSLVPDAEADRPWLKESPAEFAERLYGRDADKLLKDRGHEFTLDEETQALVTHTTCGWTYVRRTPGPADVGLRAVVLTHLQKTCKLRERELMDQETFDRLFLRAVQGACRKTLDAAHAHVAKHGDDPERPFDPADVIYAELRPVVLEMINS